MSEQNSLRTILKQPGFPQVKPLSDTLSVQLSDEKTPELIKYQKNLEELRNALSQIDSLLGESETVEVKEKCASLLGYIAAIDLPAEIKNQEAGRYPSQVQIQVAKILDTTNNIETGTQSTQTAAYNIAIMQRVHEETQIRIQQQASLSVETSRMAFEKFMRESEAVIAKEEKRFLDDSYSKESEDRLIANIAEEYDKRKKEIEKDGRVFINNFKNMSPEEQKKALEERKRQSLQMEADRIKHEREAQQWRERALQYPKGSEEYNKCMGMARSEEAQAQGIAECKRLYDKGTQRALQENFQDQQFRYNNVVKLKEEQSDQNTTDEKQGERIFGNNDLRFMPQKVQSVSQRTDQGEQQVNAFVEAGDSASKPVEQISQGSDSSAIVAPQVPSANASHVSLVAAEEFDMNGSSDVKETVVGQGISQTIAQNSQKIDENNISINSIFSSKELSLG